jgi:hypothetical protein
VPLTWAESSRVAVIIYHTRAGQARPQVTLFPALAT